LDLKYFNPFISAAYLTVVAGVTCSDSYTVPVPKFFNPLRSENLFNFRIRLLFRLWQLSMLLKISNAC